MRLFEQATGGDHVLEALLEGFVHDTLWRLRRPGNPGGTSLRNIIVIVFIIIVVYRT
jgi:hypothetical protein